MNTVATCGALGADGGWCEAALDLSGGSQDEIRLCTAGHRWTWQAGVWTSEPDLPIAAA